MAKKLMQSSEYSDVFNRMISLSDKTGISISSLLDKHCSSRSAMGAWKKGNINAELLPKIADDYGCSLDDLLRDDLNSNNRTKALDTDEQELLSNYRKSSRIDKARIQERALVSAEHAAESNEEPHITTIKLFDSSVSAGTGIYVDYTEYENIETQEDTEGADYAVKVSGNSMEPRFYDGDIVLVEIAQTVEVGEIGIFNLNGQAFIKERGEKALISLNKDYDPIVVNPGDSIACQGRVIKVLSTKVGA